MDGRYFVDHAAPAGSYALSNAADIAFWDEYRRLGGTLLLGRPMCEQFTLDDGFTYQLLERGCCSGVRSVNNH